MGDKEFRQKLARLQAMLAIKDAQVMANPMPYLQDMSDRCVELLKVLEDVEYALSPDAVFDYWDENANKNMIPNPGSIQGEAYIRCNKALSVLSEYKGVK